MLTMKTWIFSTLACAALQPIYGQLPTLDLTMADNGKDQMEFRVRPDGPFDGLISNLTFTVRWNASAGMALDTAIRLFPATDYLVASPTPIVQNGNYMYRTFNAIGFSPMSEVEASWTGHREYPFMTIDILNEDAVIELINDAWTNANNRDFFCSLNAEARTGVMFASAAPTIDIRSNDAGTGSVDVLLTPHDNFFGWVTDVNFTVRWPSADAVQLGTPEQPGNVPEYLPIEKVGTETTSGGFTYQVFHGTGLKSIANSASAWMSGEQQIVLSIPIIGSTDDLMIVNDAWTSAHEGDYAIDLNSNGHAGSVEGVTTGIEALTNAELDAQVLPSGNGFNIQLELPTTTAPLELMLYTAAGQPIWKETRSAAQRHYSTLASVANMSEGLYILAVRHGDQRLIKRVVR